MRIIKDNSKEYAITCDCCKSELAYFKSDINHQYEEYFGKVYYHSYLRCPVCKYKIILEYGGGT